MTPETLPYGYKSVMTDREIGELQRARLRLSIQWGQGKYLLRRLAGWEPDNPVIDPGAECRAFLNSWDEKPYVDEEQGELL